MTQQVINIGAAPGDATGDPARVAFNKTNDNFSELYGKGQAEGIWNFNSTITDTSAAPVSGRFHTNTGTYRNATQIAISGTTIEGLDRSDRLRTQFVGDIIQCQDSLVGAAWCRYVVQSTPIDHGTWFQFDVVLIADGGVASGNNQEIIVTFTAATAPVASGSAEYTFQTATTPPPGAGSLRFNNASAAATTAIYASNSSNGGADVKRFLLDITVGAKILIQDLNNNANFGEFNVTATPIDQTSYVQLPVASVSAGAAISNNSRVIFRIEGGAGGGGGNVSNSGTPTNGQIASWTDATHIQGISGTQTTALLDQFTSTLKGLTPSSGGGTINFLRADGTWNAPAGGGGGNVSNVGTPTNGQLAQWTDATHIQGIAAASLGFAPLASPAFTGTPTAPTPVTADNSVSIATTAFVKAQGYAGPPAGAALTKTDDANVTLTLGGTPATALLQATSITVGWTGNLAPSRGGTGITTYTLGDILYSSAANTLAKLAGQTTAAKQYLSQTGTGTVSAAPAWAAIAGADITGAALTKTDDTNVTLTLGGTPTTALLRASSITVGWTGSLAVARGGTGLASATAYAVICGGTTSTGAFQSVASVGTSGQVLTSNGAGALPTFQAAGAAAPAPGARVLIQSQTVSTAVATVDFTSGIDATYDEYEIRCLGVRIDTDRFVVLRISQDGGSTWKSGTTDYQYSYLGYHSTNAFVGAGGSTNYIYLSHGQFGGAGTPSGDYRLTFSFPASTTLKKFFTCEVVLTSTVAGFTRMSSGGVYYTDANAINGVRFLLDGTGNFIGGTFNLYGIKK